MPLLEQGLAFTGRPETQLYAGILFDMDGTIVDSTDAIVKHWHKYILLRHACWSTCNMQAYSIPVELAKN